MTTSTSEDNRATYGGQSQISLNRGGQSRLRLSNRNALVSFHSRFLSIKKNQSCKTRTEVNTFVIEAMRYLVCTVLGTSKRKFASPKLLE